MRYSARGWLKETTEVRKPACSKITASAYLVSSTGTGKISSQISLRKHRPDEVGGPPAAGRPPFRKTNGPYQPLGINLVRGAKPVREPVLSMRNTRWNRIPLSGWDRNASTTACSLSGR